LIWQHPIEKNNLRALMLKIIPSISGVLNGVNFPACGPERKAHKLDNRELVFHQQNGRRTASHGEK
jgi:hypothetical protein